MKIINIILAIDNLKRTKKQYDLLPKQNKSELQKQYDDSIEKTENLIKDFILEIVKPKQTKKPKNTAKPKPAKETIEDVI